MREHLLHGPLRSLRQPAGAGQPQSASASMPSLPTGGLQLLVIQASPFCNLDCHYCYLPDRGDTRRLPLDLLDRVMAQVMASDLPGPELAIVWHAGEPMAVPRDWYEAAFEIVARHTGGRAVRHHFQTNAVLIDDAWCDFFRRHGVRVGISVDGPAALHDAHRRTRDGRGTHARVMHGVQALRDAGLRFHAIAVLTRDALDQADALYDFFAALGVDQVGFNVEEAEAAHTQSSLQAVGSEAALRAFWARLLQRQQAEPGRLRVREVEAVLAALRHPQFGLVQGNAQNRPGQMLNVDCDGRWCFWSPELLGCRHPRLGEAVMGQLAASDPGFVTGSGLPAWADWQREIDDGVQRCRQECAYFDFCLGGAPSNKLAEHGHFGGSQTLACRLGQQVLIDAVLAALDQQLPPLR